jgi:hypothetical protein
VFIQLLYKCNLLFPNAGENLDDMTEDVITKALEGVRVRISRAENDRTELVRVITAAREEERLLLRLLALRRGAAPTEDGAPLLVHDGETRTTKPMRPTKTAEDPRHPAVQAVVRELAGAGRPLHISDLMRLLGEAQVEIPGAGTQANLITHLRRDPRLVRPSRGMYALSAWGLENMPTTTHPKRRRKRVRSAASTKRTEK